MFKKFFDMMKGSGGALKEGATYVCKGGCGARLSEKEYQNHPTKVCGTEDCANKGKPFVSSEHKEGEHCKHCGNVCKHCSANESSSEHKDEGHCEHCGDACKHCRS